MSEATRHGTGEHAPGGEGHGRPRGAGGAWRPWYWLAAALCATAAIVLMAWSMLVSTSASVSEGAAVDRIPAGEEPRESDGGLPDDRKLTPFDTDHPAIANLDAELLEAVQEAARDAEEQGIVFVVTSGWRSEEHQRHLLDEAVREYGSREEARRLVSTPEESRHVTGEAIDIGPTDAADWLVRRGSAYGLCQVYANEMWHFELLAEPGGRCPDLLPDAAAQ